MLQKLRQELKAGKTFLQFGFLKGVGQGLGMIAPLVIAKFFDPELFGSYSLAKMIVFFFSMLLIASSQTPFIVLANQEKIQTGKINKSFSTQFVFLMACLLIFLISLVLFGNQIIAFAKIKKSDLWFLLLAFFGLAAKDFLGNLFMALNQRIKNSLIELVFGSLTLVLFFVFYFLGWLNLRTVFLVYFLSASILIIVFIRMISFKVLLPLKLEKKCFSEMFDFTKWVLFGSTAAYLINWGDNLVLRYFVSMEDIGVYNLGYQFFKGFTMLCSVLGVYFLPFISQNINKSEKIKDYLWRKRPVIFMLAIVCFALVFFLLPDIFMFYGNVYHGSIKILRILLVGSLFSLHNIFYYNIYVATRKYKIFQIFNVIHVIINMLIDLLLVPKMGATGAAIATVIAFMVKSVMLELHFNIKMRRILKEGFVNGIS
jgi:O-antigen/teichoic acid export membrane protein